MSFRATRRSAVDAAAVARARSTSMPCSRSSVRGRDVSRAASSLPPEAVLARRMPCAVLASCRHLDEMLTLGRYLRVTSAIDAGSFPLKWPPTPRRRMPASVVARLSGRPRRYRFRGFIRARTRPRSDARPPRGTRSSSGRIGHRIPIQRVGLVLERVTTGGSYGSHATGGPSAEPEPDVIFSTGL